MYKKRSFLVVMGFWKGVKVNARVQPATVNLYILQLIHCPAGGHLERCPFSLSKTRRL